MILSVIETSILKIIFSNYIGFNIFSLINITRKKDLKVFYNILKRRKEVKKCLSNINRCKM